MFGILKKATLPATIMIGVTSTSVLAGSSDTTVSESPRIQSSCASMSFELAGHNCRCVQNEEYGNCVRWSGCGSHNPGGVRG